MDELLDFFELEVAVGVGVDTVECLVSTAYDPRRVMDFFGVWEFAASSAKVAEHEALVHENAFLETQEASIGEVEEPEDDC